MNKGVESSVVRGLTFDRLLSGEVVHHLLNTIMWNGLSNGRRKIPIDQMAMYILKSWLWSFSNG